jgi:hypothetical protein
MGKPLKTMEFQVPEFRTACAPVLALDAARWRCGAHRCGVWCQAGWRLVPPPRPHPAAPGRHDRLQSHCGSSAVAEARDPVSRRSITSAQDCHRHMGISQVATSEQRLGPTPERCWWRRLRQLQLVRYLPQVDGAWLQFRYIPQQPRRNCAEVLPKRHEHTLNGRAGMPAGVL